MTDYILSVDLGTTSCKTVLFDADFKVVETSKKAYDTSCTHPEINTKFGKKTKVSGD